MTSTSAATDQQPTDPDENPFLRPSELPYQLPPFDRIGEEHYRAAFERGMAEHRDEIEAIATNPEPPTFANTIEAMERSGQLLRRVSAVFFNQTSADINDTVEEIQSEVAPKLAAHEDGIHLDERLFRRIATLYADRDQLDLDAEADWLLQRYHTDFVRAGAQLTAAEHARLKELNEELSSLSTKFSDNLLAATNEAAVVVDDRAELDGLPDDAIAAAAEAARGRGLDDKYLLTLILPTGQPALASLTNRALRRRVFEASISRCYGGEHDNRPLALRMLRLRAERAKLLGYANHAAYVIADNTAGSVEAVDELLTRLVPAAVANARSEQEALRAAAGDDIDGEIRAWDWAFYSDRVRRERYAVDSDELRPYFNLERVLHDGVFYAAGQLYGLRFTERPDLPSYHAGARVFEVADDDGTPLGLFVADYYTRDSKRGGAWMNSFVDQSWLLDRLPVVVNNMNITPPPAGEPTLLTDDEVKTVFHEFGHALHGLLSRVRFPYFSGTNVPRDFVEFPSQVNEMWKLWPQVLANYARHEHTGEVLPDELADRLREASTWGEGQATTEYLAAVLLDLAWHRLDVDQIDALLAEDDLDVVERFEKETLERYGIAVDAVPPRYRTTYYAHIFNFDYSAGYYSYIWAEVLDADAVEWFKENGGLARGNGDWFREMLLSRGGSGDVMAAYERFRGRAAETEPLLRRRGLLPAE